jgi:glycosyltransferase involved in cell wall biosynthesis
MNPPQVSVVMSVYNGQRYLQDSLDSVLGQTFSDFEFLIYDDGSTDNTAEIIESRKDTRIRFFRAGTNQGLFPVLKKLIPEAKGKYIRLWSYDDIMKPNCLAAEVEFYERYPQVGFCYCGREDIDEEDRVIASHKKDATPSILSPQFATQLMFYWGSLPGNISTVIIKKETLEKVGGFNENLCQSADFDLWVRISEKYPVGFIAQPLILLRRHRAQFSRWKNMLLVNMKENRQIYETLIKRMPPELSAYAREYHRRCVYVQYFHYMVSSIARGHLDIAAGIFRELRRYERIPVLFWLWLSTLGGRIRRMQPKFIE